MKSQSTKSKLFLRFARLMLSAIPVFLPIAVFAQLSSRSDGMRFIPDVPGQFRALTERPDALGFHIGSSPNPSSCRHYQAITRVDAADGTPYFLVTRSGNTPELGPLIPNEGGCLDSPNEKRNGNLIVVRMGSRDKNGERLRSNRLRKGVHVDDTPPNSLDRATIYYTVVGGNPNDPDPAKRPGLVVGDGPAGTIPPRVYQHPGGMQLIGNILALVVEKPRQEAGYQRATDPTMVMFFDVSDPERPVFKSSFVPKVRVQYGGIFTLTAAGVLGVTPLPDNHYLLAVGGGSNDPLHFFRSTGTDLASPNLTWEYSGRVLGLGADSGLGNDDQIAHQTLQFIREGNIDGRLYLAGARGNTTNSQNRLDLYEVTCPTKFCRTNEGVSLTKRYNGQLITPFPNTGGSDELVNLAAASGFHVTPSSELLFYATEHDNDGPSGTVKAGEWRHREIVRAGSPTLSPTIQLNGSHTVDEGSSVTIGGTTKPPITKPWIQLYHSTDYGSFYPVIDFADYGLDDFDNFSMLENLPGVLSHQNKAQSWKWYAPAGCSIEAFDLNAGLRTLDGTNFVERAPNLSQILNGAGTGNLSQKIDRIEFSPTCAVREAFPYNLFWDFDGNGSYETGGNSIVFNAANADGPSVVNLPAQARHSMGGTTAQATTAVTIRNVAPSISILTVDYSTVRFLLNPVSVPYALTGNVVSVRANFTDPGVLDRQTAMFNWGNGRVDTQTAFTTFNDAYGDGAGTVSHTYRYQTAGTFQLALTVRDDDGGTNTKTKTLRVLTPEQSVVQIVGWLDQMIAAATNPNIQKSMQNARVALVGSNGSGGALAMIRAGRKEPAQDFLQQAIGHLRRAAADGAGVEVLNILLEDTAAALSAV